VISSLPIGLLGLGMHCLFYYRSVGIGCALLLAAIVTELGVGELR
jgi:hypothetical protein